VLVEAAFVFPVFLLLLFGMIEFGFIFKDSLTLSSMVQTGARTGAVEGNATGPSADYEILSTMAVGSGSLDSTIQSVIIFNADPTSPGGDPLSAPPSQCIQAANAAALSNDATPSPGVTGACNVYDEAQWSLIPGLSATQIGTDFSGSTASGGWDGGWPPSTRIVQQSSTTGPDYLGVYITAYHQTLTGFFGSQTLHETDIVRLEPQSFS
jgi:Flp pilus assembly protein TadG